MKKPEEKKELRERLPEERRVPVDNVFDAVFARYRQTLPGLEAAFSRRIEPEELAKKPNFKQNAALNISRV